MTQNTSQNTSKNNLQKNPHKLPLFRGNRPIVAIVILLDAFLIFVARDHYQSLNEVSAAAISRNPAQTEDPAVAEGLAELEKLANKGAWDEFEKTRIEQVAHYLQSNQTPASGTALYFYPETLSDRSFEKRFALDELGPKINALKQAHLSKKRQEMTHAFQQLKSRVLNYELGASADPANLSEEARMFLRLYSEFDKIKDSEKP